MAEKTMEILWKLMEMYGNPRFCLIFGPRSEARMLRSWLGGPRPVARAAGGHPPGAHAVCGEGLAEGAPAAGDGGGLRCAWPRAIGHKCVEIVGSGLFFHGF